MCTHIEVLTKLKKIKQYSLFCNKFNMMILLFFWGYKPPLGSERGWKNFCFFPVFLERKLLYLSMKNLPEEHGLKYLAHGIAGCIKNLLPISDMIFCFKPGREILYPMFCLIFLGTVLLHLRTDPNPYSSCFADVCMSSGLAQCCCWEPLHSACAEWPWVPSGLCPWPGNITCAITESPFIICSFVLAEI